MEMGTEKKKMGLSTKIFIALLAGTIRRAMVHSFLTVGFFKGRNLGMGVFYVC